MTIKVTLELQSKPETINDVIAALQDILPDTRAYDGCSGVEVSVNQDDGLNILLIEQWASREHYERYLAWREETGALAALGEIVAQAPNIRYWDAVDA